jgi:4-hydroxyacetophenone monooxygenase
MVKANKQDRTSNAGGGSVSALTGVGTSEDARSSPNAPSVLDRDKIRSAIAEADLPVLLMVLVHLTGEHRWIEPPFLPDRDMRIFADESGGLPIEVQEEIRSAAVDVLSKIAPGDTFADISEDLFSEMMRVCVADEVPPEYGPLLLEEMGFRDRKHADPVSVGPEDFSALVIGAGVAGIAASVALTTAGIPHTIIEKNHDVGGTWLENTYPEAGVDTPNHWYSFSFARNHDWRHYFSKQPEILDYLRGVADTHGVRERIRFGTTARSSRYDETRQRWHTVLVLPDGTEETLETNAVISGVGGLNQPKIPSFPGMESYRGTLFHTARWPADLDLTGKRIAIVGTGASCVQAARLTAERAHHLTIIQRSPQWISPNSNYRAEVGEGKRWLLQNVPYYAAWYRFTLFWRYGDSLLPHITVDPDWEHPERAVNSSNDRHRKFFSRYIEQQLDGRPDLVAKSLPTYPPYGKRMILDNDWYKTIRRDDVTLVDEAVTRFDETGLITDSGDHHDVDIVALATGFHATRFLWPLEVIGRDGTTIREAWNDDDPRTHLGMTTPGFPNLFMMLGPNTFLGHGGSAIFIIETQINYIVKCLVRMIREGIGTIEPRIEPFEAYNASIEAAHENLVFTHRGMNNWYKNSRGRVVTLTPFRLVDYWGMTRDPDFTEYETTPAMSTLRKQ